MVDVSIFFVCSGEGEGRSHPRWWPGGRLGIIVNRGGAQRGGKAPGGCLWGVQGS